VPSERDQVGLTQTMIGWRYGSLVGEQGTDAHGLGARLVTATDQVVFWRGSVMDGWDSFPAKKAKSLYYVPLFAVIVGIAL